MICIHSEIIADSADDLAEEVSRIPRAIEEGISSVSNGKISTDTFLCSWHYLLPAKKSYNCGLIPQPDSSMVA